MAYGYRVDVPDIDMIRTDQEFVLGFIPRRCDETGSRNCTSIDHAELIQLRIQSI